MFQLTMHPHIIGYRSRMWILEELIRHIKRAAAASGSPRTPTSCRHVDARLRA